MKVIAVYGPQETDESELRNDFYMKLGLEIEKCNNAGPGVLIVGDLNAKLKTDEVKTIVHESGNGKLLTEAVQDFGLEVMNFSEICTGTWTWTKKIRGVTNSSKLDYLIVDKQVSDLVCEMEIDEEKVHCPFHKKKVNKKKKKGRKTKKSNDIVYSDHNAIICKLGIFPAKIKSTKESRWIITQKGLEKFKAESTIFSIERGCTDDYSALEKAIFSKMSDCFRRVW